MIALGCGPSPVSGSVLTRLRAAMGTLLWSADDRVREAKLQGGLTAMGIRSLKTVVSLDRLLGA